MFKEQPIRKLNISSNWCLEDTKNGKSDYFLATVVWKGGGVDELNEPRPSMQWRFDPHHPPIRIQQQVVTSWLWGSWSWRWWWRLWRWWWIDGGGGRCWWGSTRGNHWLVPPIKKLWPHDFGQFQVPGVINACLDGFQKAPCLANYFLSDPPLPTHTVVTWICVLYRFVRLLHGFVPVLIQPAHRER